MVTHSPPKIIRDCCVLYDTLLACCWYNQQRGLCQHVWRVLRATAHPSGPMQALFPIVSLLLSVAAAAGMVVLHTHAGWLRATS